MCLVIGLYLSKLSLRLFYFGRTWTVFFILSVKINQADDSHGTDKYWNCDCSHSYFSSFVLSFIKINPAVNVIAADNITHIIIHGFCISPNTDDNKSAVTMYFAMSINHFPNSFFILQKYGKSDKAQNKNAMFYALFALILDYFR